MKFSFVITLLVGFLISFSFHNSDSTEISIIRIEIYSVLIFCAITIGVFMQFIYRRFRREYTFSSKGSDIDFISKALRKCQYILCPLTFAVIAFLITKYVISEQKLLLETPSAITSNLILLTILLIISMFVYFYSFQIIQFHNIYVWRRAFKIFVCSILCLVICWNLQEISIFLQTTLEKTAISINNIQ